MCFSFHKDSGSWIDWISNHWRFCWVSAYYSYFI
jgi:hypothetical protein